MLMFTKVALNNRHLEFNGNKLDRHIHFSRFFYESSYYKLFHGDEFQNILLFLGLEKRDSLTLSALTSCWCNRVCKLKKATSIGR